MSTIKIYWLTIEIKENRDLCKTVCLTEYHCPIKGGRVYMVKFIFYEGLCFRLTIIIYLKLGV